MTDQQLPVEGQGLRDRAIARLKQKRDFGAHLFVYLVVNAFVDATDSASASRAAASAAAAGLRCVKVKVGVGDDAGRLGAVRDAVGPRVAIRVDANGAWSPEDAVGALRALSPVGLELCEEPTPGVSGIRAVRAAWLINTRRAPFESIVPPDRRSQLAPRFSRPLCAPGDIPLSHRGTRIAENRLPLSYRCHQVLYQCASCP